MFKASVCKCTIKPKYVCLHVRDCPTSLDDELQKKLDNPDSRLYKIMNWDFQQSDSELNVNFMCVSSQMLKRKHKTTQGKQANTRTTRLQQRWQTVRRTDSTLSSQLHRTNIHQTAPQPGLVSAQRPKSIICVYELTNQSWNIYRGVNKCVGCSGCICGGRPLSGAGGAGRCGGGQEED